MTVSREFSRRIAATYGGDGERWLAALPALLKDIASRWSLTIEPPFADMSYSYVAPVTRRDGGPAVLKLAVPNPELQTEIEALRAFDGRGSVRLLEADQDTGALLLERLVPGEAVVRLEDDEVATSVAAQVMAELHEIWSGNGAFPSVRNWAKGLDRLRSKFEDGTGPFPRDLVELAEARSRELLASMDEQKLLHGDLHHWNILSAQRKPWLAIDPKGVLGEPAYETGAWLRNPFPDLLRWPNPRNEIARRADQFSSELGFDRERILGWGVYQAVLAGWWSYEDGDLHWDKWIRIAQIISESP